MIDFLSPDPACLTADPLLRQTQPIHALELILRAVGLRAAMRFIGEVVAVIVAI